MCDIIGILCRYAIRSGRHPSGSQRPPGPPAGPTQGLHLAHMISRMRIGIYSIPTDKENRINITRILSVDAVLSPSIRSVWGFLLGPRVLLHCSNERLEYYAARGKPLWRHNGFVTSSIHSHDKTNEHTLSYRCANNAIGRCQSNYRK